MLRALNKTTRPGVVSLAALFAPLYVPRESRCCAAGARKCMVWKVSGLFILEVTGSHIGPLFYTAKVVSHPNRMIGITFRPICSIKIRFSQPPPVFDNSDL